MSLTLSKSVVKANKTTYKMTSSFLDKVVSDKASAEPAKHPIIKRVIYGCFE